MKIDDFKTDKESRKNYLNKYAGREMPSASENFYKFIESKQAV